jgi:hypothetical protein
MQRRIHRSLAMLLGLAVLCSYSNVLGASQILILPRFQVSEGYNDNLFGDSSDAKDSFITSISPGITASLTGQNGLFVLDYQPEYVIYHSFTDRNAWQHDANAKGEYRFSRKTTLSINDDYNYSDDPVTNLYQSVSGLTPDENQPPETQPAQPTDTTFEQGDTTVRKRSRETSNNGELKVHHAFSELNELTLGYKNYLRNYADPELEDSSGHNPNLEWKFWPNSKLGFETTVGYTRGDFEVSQDFDEIEAKLKAIRKLSPNFDTYAAYRHLSMDFEAWKNDNTDHNNAEVNIGDESVDYQIYEPTVGIDYKTQTGTDILIEGGWHFIDSSDGASDSGPTALFKLDKPFNQNKGKIGFSGETGYSETYFTTENLGLNQFYKTELKAEYHWSRHVATALRAWYSHFDYKNLDYDRKDDETGGGISIVYEDIQGEITGAYRQNDQINQFSDNEDIAFFGATLSYSPRSVKWMKLSLAYRYLDVNEDSLENDDYEINQVQFTVTILPVNPYRFN